jgi:hypothetical protein
MRGRFNLAEGLAVLVDPPGTPGARHTMVDTCDQPNREGSVKGCSAANDHLVTQLAHDFNGAGAGGEGAAAPSGESD